MCLWLISSGGAQTLEFRLDRLAGSGAAVHLALQLLLRPFDLQSGDPRAVDRRVRERYRRYR